MYEYIPSYQNNTDEKARLEEREKALKDAKAKAEADVMDRDAKIKALE